MEITVGAVVQVWITGVGSIFGVSELFQLRKILKRGSSEGVSITTWWLTLFCQTQWLFYGFYIKDVPIICTNVFCALVSCCLVAVLYAHRTVDRVIFPTLSGKGNTDAL